MGEGEYALARETRQHFLMIFADKTDLVVNSGNNLVLSRCFAMSTSPNFTLTSAKRSFRLKSELAVCVTFVNDFFVNISRLVFPCSLPWPFARLLWHFAAVMETRETQRRRTELTWSHGRNFLGQAEGSWCTKIREYKYKYKEIHSRLQTGRCVSKILTQTYSQILSLSM